MSVRHAAAFAVTVLLVSSASAVTEADAVSTYSPPAQRPAMISIGDDHTLVVTPAGTVRAWGGNHAGEVGDGSVTERDTPVTVIGFSGSAPLNHVVEVATGEQTSYALLADGTVAAWGLNDYGQLGDGGFSSSSPRPVQVRSTSGKGPLRNVVSIASGSNFVVALLSNHTVVAWGSGGLGTLGNGQEVDAPTPVVVHGSGRPVLTDVVSVAAGDIAAYAVTSTGTAYSWGDGLDGELGDNDPGDSNQSTPVHVAGVGGAGSLTHIVDVAGGFGFALALLVNGTVVSWGYAANGSLGTGATNNSIAPESVYALGDRIAAIGTGGTSATGVAVAASGAVLAWGTNGHGQLGDGTRTAEVIPTRVGALSAGSGVVQVTAGEEQTTAITGDGTDYVWGGFVGDGVESDALTPTQPYALGRVGLPKLFLLKAPVLSGTARAGHRLSATAGTWGLPATSHGYQWLRDGRAITGATRSSYKLVAADRKHHVSVRVSAGRAGYPGNSTTTRAVLVSR